MKIIITESQYKMLLESNTDSMQNLIDMAFEGVKENCEGGYYIRSHQSHICDPIDMIEEIKVVDVSKSTSMDYFEKECYIKEIFPPIPINDDQVNNYIDLEGGTK
jgi:hypothetical protein